MSHRIPEHGPRREHADVCEGESPFRFLQPELLLEAVEEGWLGEIEERVEFLVARGDGFRTPNVEAHYSVAGREDGENPFFGIVSGQERGHPPSLRSSLLVRELFVLPLGLLLERLNERGDEVDRNRENRRRILLRSHFGQGLQVAKLEGHRVVLDDHGCVGQLL